MNLPQLENNPTVFPAEALVTKCSTTMNPHSISRFKKERFLLTLSEDEFRDRVVRPLFLRQGLTDGRDNCGPNEQGKDAIFATIDPLGVKDYYAVQTKRGKVSLAGKHSENLENAIAQIRTALATKIPLVASKENRLPSKVFLCTSGKITETARAHIVDTVPDPRVLFFDSDELIPKIDSFMPELWLGIDVDRFPYLRAIKRVVDAPKEDQSVSDILPSNSLGDAASDSMFVELRVMRSIMVPRRQYGKVTMEPKIEELPVSSINSRKERLILITGDAGSGKSTSLKRIAYVLAEKSLSSDKPASVPILLRSLDILADPTLPLAQLCANTTKAISHSEKPAFDASDLKDGRLAILVDGLDELSSDADREIVIRQLLDFHAMYAACQVVVASRDYAFIRSIPSLHTFTQFRLYPISFRQAEKLLKRFEKKRSLAPEKSKEILRRLQEVHGMELNPLLVTVFAATTDHARRDIPANITELFKKYTEMMLGRWDAGKGMSQQYHAPLKDFLLRVLAFEMHRRKVTHILVEEFRAIIAKELEKRGHQAEIDQLTEEILQRSGLFRVLGNRVEFRHHLLQEFFAGRGIEDSTFLASVVTDEWWQRSVVFYFGERPGDSLVFRETTESIKHRPPMDRFNAAVALGMALQACYLMNIDEKVGFMPWLINSISEAKDEFLSSIDPQQRLPLSRFLTYYLIGRDALACSVLKDQLTTVETLLALDTAKPEIADLKRFWILAGLIECGEAAIVEERLREFLPTDDRLALGIHLGCFLIQHHKVVDAEEKKAAKAICTLLAERISHLRKSLVSEFKTELLELQRGNIAALEIPMPSGSHISEAQIIQ